jgi:hypothetical protein
MAKRKPKAKAKSKAKAAPKFNRAAARRPEAEPAPARPTGGISVGGKAPKRLTREQVQLNIAQVYQLKLSDELGKVMLADLMTESGMLDPITETDPVSVGKRIGRREMALHITKMMGLRPEHFPAMAWAASDQMATLMAGE